MTPFLRAAEHGLDLIGRRDELCRLCSSDLLSSLSLDLVDEGAEVSACAPHIASVDRREGISQLGQEAVLGAVIQTEAAHECTEIGGLARCADHGHLESLVRAVAGSISRRARHGRGPDREGAARRWGAGHGNGRAVVGRRRQRIRDHRPRGARGVHGDVRRSREDRRRRVIHRDRLRSRGHEADEVGGGVNDRIAALMNREDARAVRAVGRVAREIASAVDLIVAALGAGGRLIFVGAGTSGRLGVLEAAECPPTFGTPPSRVQAIMAGGRASVFRSREGAEDDTRAGARAVRAGVRGGDVVVGVSASGVTPFVQGALAAARRAGAKTVLVSCNPARALLGRPSGAGGPAKASRRQTRKTANVIIAPAPGPEVLAGSTRLKAGTATKLILNTLTTASMARLGKVYGNRMVDVQPRSRKLRERAARLVAEIGAVPPARARRLLAAAGGRVPVAIVMARRDLPADAAARALRVAGSLRPVIERGGGEARFARR